MTPRRPDGALEVTGAGQPLAALSPWPVPRPVTGVATGTAIGPTPGPAAPRHRGR